MSTKVKQKKYLDSEPLSAAMERFREALKREGIGEPLPSERIAVELALGRVTAEAVTAMISSPFYHAAAMDGVAVRFSDTFGASETRPLRLRVPDDAVFIDTGEPVPEGMNAVIMIEEVEVISEREVEILKPVTPWKHVRTVGEDIVATELIIPENHVLRPVDMAAMLASGHTHVLVRRRPRVAVIPTGSELVHPGSTLARGNIIDFNSTLLSSMAAERGADPVKKDIVHDDTSLLRDSILEALAACDLVVVNAGSSRGEKILLPRSSPGWAR